MKTSALVKIGRLVTKEITEEINDKIDSAKEIQNDTGNDSSKKNMNPFEVFESMEKKGMAPQEGEQIDKISDLIDCNPDFNSANWDNLSPQERVSALSALENQIAELTMRNSCNIVVQDLPDGVMGCQLGDTITLSKDLLEKGSSYDVLNTMIHEGRHAYQDYNVLVKAVEPNQEHVKAWLENYKMGYQNGESGIFDFNRMGYRRYYTQPLEYDARAFAQSVLNSTDLGEV